MTKTKLNSLTNTLTTALLLTTSTMATAQSFSPRPAGSYYTTCPQVPSLKCRHGSTCISGEASFDKKHNDAIDILTHQSGYHCDCLPGYIGHECEVKVEDCGESGDPFGSILHSCYHGSSCRQSGSERYCDCNSLNEDSSPTATKFAGLMCEHEATSLCAVSLVESSAPNGQFCTNHGKCVKMVTEDEPHPGCECRSGWMGDHCEIRADAFATLGLSNFQDGDDVNGGGNKTAGKVLFSILMIAIAGVVVVILVIVIKARREKLGPKERAVGKTAADLGIADLEADGSGTLGADVGARGDVIGDRELEEAGTSEVASAPEDDLDLEESNDAETEGEAGNVDNGDEDETEAADDEPSDRVIL